MSKLQNNFTTPEQSKRLLELGVPAWTADCYNIINSDVYNKDEIRVRQNDYEINYSFFNNKHYNPCWSVGRLIELLCINDMFFDYGGCSYRRGYNIIDYIISSLEAEEDLEFQKLDE